MQTPRSIVLFLFAVALPSVFCACRDSAARMNSGLRLPEGDESRGKEAFIGLKCHQCHSVAGVSLPEPESKSAIHFELGGEVRQVKSYGELVTAIIRPNHIVSENYLWRLDASERRGAVSPMPDFNQRITVAQLIDIVAFLHGRYQKMPPPGVNYPYYLP